MTDWQVDPHQPEPEVTAAALTIGARLDPTTRAALLNAVDADET